MRTFMQNTVFSPRLRTRTITSGRSAQFPTMSQIEAAYHTPGAELTGQAAANRIQHNERVINVDQMLVAHTYINDFDLLLNHYDVWGPYAEELGRGLQRADDIRCAAAIIRAARTAGQFGQLGGQSGVVSTVANGSGASAGTRNTNLQNANMGTDARTLINAIIYAKQGMDERNVPDGKVYCALRPAQHALLVSLPASGGPLAVNKDWNGNNGTVDGGMVYRVGGVELLKTNLMPSTNVTTQGASVTGGESYNGNFSNTTAVVWQEQAAGVVQVQGIKTETSRQHANLAWLLTSSFLRGVGVLRPQAAAELGTADVADAGLLPA